jgi:outer membrane cobalamin receptor
VGAWFELAPGLGILPTVSYVGKRVPDLFVASKLKEYVCADLHAEYALLHALGVTLDLRNLTNSKFEEWSGYQAVPLTITAGVNIRW